jgi:hypothetical protein
MIPKTQLEEWRRESERCRSSRLRRSPISGSGFIELMDELMDLRIMNAHTILALISELEGQTKVLEQMREESLSLSEFYGSKWRSDVVVGPSEELCEDSGTKARQFKKRWFE